MKLLKPLGCLFPGGGGNVKEKTTLVEVQGIDFRTGVRLPSSPLKAEETNCCSTAKIAVFRNVFSVIVSTDTRDIPTKAQKLTFAMLQQWIEETHGMTVSKSSITQVKNKCGIEKLAYGMKATIIPELKTKKENLVYEAFKHFGLA